MTTPRLSDAQHAAVAALALARREGRALAEFPGPMSTDIASAYAMQEGQMALRSGALGGWKVAMIRPEFREQFTAPRLIGPVYADTIVVAGADEIALPVIAGGFAAIEAEYAVRMARDLPPRPAPYSEAEVAAAVGSLHVAVELAGSPIAQLNALGPAANIPDMGGNAGLVVGPAIDGALNHPLDRLTATVTVDGKEVGRGSATNVPGGPLGALTFCVEVLRQRGRGLAAGDYISTGATTGVHDVRPGQSAVIDFPGHTAFRLRLVAAGGAT